MPRGRRFLASSATALVGAVAAGRWMARRRWGGEPGTLDHDLLGSARGRPRTIRGPLGSRIYTETLGAGPGTLVFTHGWCVSEAIWHHQKEALVAGPRAPSVVTWDLPGHGHSTALPPGRLTMERGVESLARVVEACTDGPVVLVGHSLGGVLTLGYLLERAETARDRIRGVVLVNTPLVHVARGVAGRWPGSSLEARVMSRVMELAVDNGVVDRWFGGEVGSRDPRAASYRLIRLGFGPDPSPAHVRFVRDMAASVPPAVRADTFRLMGGFDFRTRLAELAVPALVVIGARDRLVNPADWRAFAPRIPRVEIEEFPDAGHALFLERHERFNEVVGRFAGRRLRRPATPRNGRPVG